MVKGLIDCPFLVINADDYYGKEGFRKIHEYMVNEMTEDGDVYDICMGGFILRIPSATTALLPEAFAKRKTVS